MIHGPKETKARQSQPAVITLYRLQKPAWKPASFEKPVSETRCFYRFAIRCFPVGGCTVTVGQAADRGQRRKTVIRDTSGVDHGAVTILSARVVHWTEALHRFSSRNAVVVVGSA